MKEKIAKSYFDFMRNSNGSRSQFAGDAYQLAVCCALGFGVPFTPNESVRWLETAAMNGFQRAKEALPKFRMIFDEDLQDYTVPPTDSMGELVIEPPSPEPEDLPGIMKVENEEDWNFLVNGKTVDVQALLL